MTASERQPRDSTAEELGEIADLPAEPVAWSWRTASVVGSGLDQTVASSSRPPGAR